MSPKSIWVCSLCRLTTDTRPECHPPYAILAESSSIIRGSDGRVIDCQMVSAADRTIAMFPEDPNGT